VKVFKEGLGLLAGEVIDAAVMNVAALRKFYAKTIDEAKRDGTLLSLHLKATMMKISDPVMFGHCVSVFYAAALDKHAGTLKEIGANVNKRSGRRSGEAGEAAAGEERPRSRPTSPRSMPRGRPSPWSIRARASPTCTCPTTPSSTPRCPNIVPTAAACGTRDDQLQDTVAMVPDRCYATIYQTIIDDCRKHGQFNPATMAPWPTWD